MANSGFVLISVEELRDVISQEVLKAISMLPESKKVNESETIRGDRGLCSILGIHKTALSKYKQMGVFDSAVVFGERNKTYSKEKVLKCWEQWKKRK